MDTTTLIVFIVYGMSVIISFVVLIAVISGERPKREYSMKDKLIWYILFFATVICPVIQQLAIWHFLFSENEDTYRGLKIMRSTIYKNLVFLPVFLLILLFFI